MIKCKNWPISVCTWSLKDDFDKLNTLRDQTGVSHLHLSTIPAIEGNGDSYLSRIQKEDWDISATMIGFPQEDYSTLEMIKVTGGVVPDEHWESNKSRVARALEITAELKAEYLSIHFGFIDPSDIDQNEKLIDRAKTIAEMAVEKNVKILLETGQESADELLEFIEQVNHPAFIVNFDPANMILYAKGNPIEAIQKLASLVHHIHIKDAVATKVPGTWGTEVPWGDGQVGTDDFLKTLEKIGFNGALAVEREAGDNRLGDIKLAIERLTNF